MLKRWKTHTPAIFLHFRLLFPRAPHLRLHSLQYIALTSIAFTPLSHLITFIFIKPNATISPFCLYLNPCLFPQLITLPTKRKTDKEKELFGVGDLCKFFNVSLLNMSRSSFIFFNSLLPFYSSFFLV